jgi:hypothetical protein
VYNDYRKTDLKSDPFLKSYSKMTNAAHKQDRTQFIGGSDAWIIMGKDEKATLRLWREKRGEVAAPDLPSVLIVQLGLVTERSGQGDVRKRSVPR